MFKCGSNLGKIVVPATKSTSALIAVSVTQLPLTSKICSVIQKGLVWFPLMTFLRLATHPSTTPTTARSSSPHKGHTTFWH